MYNNARQMFFINSMAYAMYYKFSARENRMRVLFLRPNIFLTGAAMVAKVGGVFGL
jgi:hypothetical protein